MRNAKSMKPNLFLILFIVFFSFVGLFIGAFISDSSQDFLNYEYFYIYSTLSAFLMAYLIGKNTLQRNRFLPEHIFFRSVLLTATSHVYCWLLIISLEYIRSLTMNSLTLVPFEMFDGPPFAMLMTLFSLILFGIPTLIGAILSFALVRYFSKK